MTIKIKNENYYSVEDLMEKLKLGKDFVLYEIRENRLGGQYFVSETDLQKYKEAEIKRNEIKTRLEKRALELSKAYEEKNKGMVEESSYPRGEKRKGNYKTWELKGV